MIHHAHYSQKWIATVDGYKESKVVNVDFEETVWETFETEKRFVAETKGKLARLIAEEIGYVTAQQIATNDDTSYLVENRIKLYNCLEELVEFPS